MFPDQFHCVISACELFFLRIVDFPLQSTCHWVGNGQVNFTHTGCSHQTPALHVHFAQPIWLALEGVAKLLCQFIGQNKVWEGRWVGLGGGEGDPAAALEKNAVPPIVSHSSSLWTRLTLGLYDVK